MISFDRIKSILNPDEFKDIHILVVGIGSGNANVVSELVKNGITNFHIWDHDILEPENLVRHVLGIDSLGRNKAEAMKDFILNRNPECKVEVFPVKYQDSKEFFDILESNKKMIGLIGVDDHSERFRLNGIFVKNKVPFTLAMVFRKGVGGMAFKYDTLNSCLNCIDTFARKNGLYLANVENERTDNSEEEIYGQNLDRFVKAPGLSIDIGFISLIQARITLELISEMYDVEYKVPKTDANLIAFSNYPNELTKNGFFERTAWYLITPDQECITCSINKE